MHICTYLCATLHNLGFALQKSLAQTANKSLPDLSSEHQGKSQKISGFL
jgi:hypothetical protein